MFPARWLLRLLVSLALALAYSEVARYSDYKCVGSSDSDRSCHFQNVCFSAWNKTWLFYHERGVTALPFATKVNFETGEVTWTDEVFDRDFAVALDAAYYHKTSLYESQAGFSLFKKPMMVDGPVPTVASDELTVEWDSSPVFLYTRTHHDDNLGHLIFDTYHPLLTAIDTHIGMDKAVNVTTVDLIWAIHSFSRIGRINTYEAKWKVLLGDVLFHKQYHFRDWFMEKKKKKILSCYDSLIVGCGQLAGSDGKVHHRAKPTAHIRKVLWGTYAPHPVPDRHWIPSSTLTSSIGGSGVGEAGSMSMSGSGSMSGSMSGSTIPEVRILLLYKNHSNWGHMNTVGNWPELAHAVRSLPGVNVTIIAPYATPFEQQVALYKQADIVVSKWGGIAMLNFLLPPGAVEIVLTSWYRDLMPLPVNMTVERQGIRSGQLRVRDRRQLKRRGKKKDYVYTCPDFDAPVKDNIDILSLRYCTSDDGYESNVTVDVPRFMNLVRYAVRYRRHKLIYEGLKG